MRLITSIRKPPSERVRLRFFGIPATDTDIISAQHFSTGGLETAGPGCYDAVAIKWTRLSCRSFAAKAVRLQFHALADNFGNFMRTLAIPRAAEPWSLTSLREADQDRCEGREPRPLRHIPDGRGCGIAADVQRYPHG
jgi:hypothetical protein